MALFKVWLHPGVPLNPAPLTPCTLMQVRGLTKVRVASEEEALMQYFAGDQGRSTAGHILNAHSSRSHCIFTVHLEIRTSEAASERAILSKLNMVDLAGSGERREKRGGKRCGICRRGKQGRKWDYIYMKRVPIRVFLHHPLLPPFPLFIPQSVPRRRVYPARPWWRPSSSTAACRSWSRCVVVYVCGGGRKGQARGRAMSRRIHSCTTDSLPFSCWMEQTVNALSKRESYVPYRQSKLTSVLRDALGGNCKVTDWGVKGRRGGCARRQLQGETEGKWAGARLHKQG